MDFLTFKSFISIDILIIFYYIGAIFVPIFLFLAKGYLQRKFLILEKSNNFFKALFSSFSLKNRVLFILFMIFMFLFMELFWRMGFEAMIGYFQMVQALKGV